MLMFMCPHELIQKNFVIYAVFTHWVIKLNLVNLLVGLQISNMPSVIYIIVLISNVS